MCRWADPALPECCRASSCPAVAGSIDADSNGPATIALRHAVRIQLAEEGCQLPPPTGPGRLLQDLPEEGAAVRGLKHDEVTGQQRRRPGRNRR